MTVSLYYIPQYQRPHELVQLIACCYPSCTFMPTMFTYATLAIFSVQVRVSYEEVVAPGVYSSASHYRRWVFLQVPKYVWFSSVMLS